MRRICSVLFVLWAAAPAAPAPAVAPASLIYAGWYGNTIPTPTFVRDHKAFLETQPFDGLVVYLRNPTLTVNVTTGVMTPTAYSYETIASVLAPLKGLTWNTLTENLALVQGSRPPDFFDSWSVTVQNFANLARAIREAGLKGICFDNEQYFSPWGNYPEGVKYSRTLAEYQAQARLRGREVMAAMAAQFPDIAVVTLHGPYVSEPKAPSSLGFPQWQSGNELLGPFFSGFMEGVGAGAAVNSDGGELYTLRTATQFQASYDWRKYSLPSDAINCAFIPPSLRPSWSALSSIAFGVYDRPFGGAAMDPSIARTTIAHALRRADRFVWFYTEGSTFLLPSSQGGASSTWVEAVRLGKAEGQATTAPTAPEAPAGLVAASVSTSEIVLGWSDRSTDETGFKIERRTGSAGTWGLLATTAAGAVSHRDTGLAAGTPYTYRVRATNAAGDSAASNEASATTPTAAVVQSVGSFTLINADTNQPVAGFDPLPDGATLNLDKLPTRRLNIRANTSPPVVGSVIFDYDGSANVNTESNAPYALAGDTAGDYLPWTPSVGSHSVRATPYSGFGGAGAAGTSRIVTFTVTDPPGRRRNEAETASEPDGSGGSGSCGFLGAEVLLLWAALIARRRRFISR